ncbi:pectinesterase family protein [Marinomonas sp.]|uniref:pectinesterase family protein n=1 Tax=Marinomonas sp. TaxID=1904862 RepID=UPI003BAA51A3
MQNYDQYHAIVSLNNPFADFDSIQAAIDAAPADSSTYRIYIDKGCYQERICIRRNNIELIGEGAETTIICEAVCADMLEYGGQLASTLGSRIVEVDAVAITLKHLSIVNEWDYIENAKKPDDDPSKVQHKQAVALLLNSNSDKIRLEHVNLESYQDTFCTQGGRSHLKHCKISGNIDFVFGCGNALLEECDIVCRAWPSQTSVWGYIAAPSTSFHQNDGLTFLRCRVIRENGQVPKHSYALGRPWHPTTQFSDGRYADPNAIGKAVFIECQLDDHIYGWDKMHGLAPDGTQRNFEPDKDARFFECNNHGPGANHGGVKAELPEHERIQYLKHNEWSW